jgi:type VI secretion system protein ImpH
MNNELVNYSSHLLWLDQAVKTNNQQLSFGINPSLAFNARFIESISVLHDKVHVTLNYHGLCGSSSPMPLHFCEKVINLCNDEQTVPLDFLDLFHNNYYQRILTLLNQQSLIVNQFNKSPNQYQMAIDALAGIGSRLSLQKLYQHLPQLLPKYRSYDGLIKLLSSEFQLPITVESFYPVRYQLKPFQQNRLGIVNRSLGDNCFLGSSYIAINNSFSLKITLDSSKDDIKQFMADGVFASKIRKVCNYYLSSAYQVIISLQIQCQQQLNIQRLGYGLQLGQCAKQKQTFSVRYKL